MVIAALDFLTVTDTHTHATTHTYKHREIYVVIKWMIYSCIKG